MAQAAAIDGERVTLQLADLMRLPFLAPLAGAPGQGVTLLAAVTRAQRARSGQRAQKRPKWSAKMHGAPRQMR